MKKPTLFLFQWDVPAARARAASLRAQGWVVRLETADGARGGKKLLEKPPDVVLFDLAKRPSHSRETAGGIRSYRAGRTIPMVFVDGTNEDIRKTRDKVSDPVFTTSSRLFAALESAVAKRSGG